MITSYVLRPLLGLTTVLGTAWIVKAVLARVNGTIVRDVRSGR